MYMGRLNNEDYKRKAEATKIAANQDEEFI